MASAPRENSYRYCSHHIRSKLTQPKHFILSNVLYPLHLRLLGPTLSHNFDA